MGGSTDWRATVALTGTMVAVAGTIVAVIVGTVGGVVMLATDADVVVVAVMLMARLMKS